MPEPLYIHQNLFMILVLDWHLNTQKAEPPSSLRILPKAIISPEYQGSDNRQNLEPRHQILCRIWTRDHHIQIIARAAVIFLQLTSGTTLRGAFSLGKTFTFTVAQGCHCSPMITLSPGKRRFCPHNHKRKAKTPSPFTSINRANASISATL